MLARCPCLMLSSRDWSAHKALPQGGVAVGEWFTVTFEVMQQVRSLQDVVGGQVRCIGFLTVSKKTVGHHMRIC